MHKAVRSKGFLMNRITDLKDICNEDWDNLLPDDMTHQCYASFPDQLHYLIQLQILKVKEICYILKISTKTYYNVLRDEKEQDEDNRVLEDLQMFQKRMKRHCLKNSSFNNVSAIVFHHAKHAIGLKLTLMIKDAKYFWIGTGGIALNSNISMNYRLQRYIH